MCGTTVKHLLFPWPYFRNLPYLLQFLHKEYMYWRGFYFQVSMLSQIYAKIKSSQIKSVLHYRFINLFILIQFSSNKREQLFPVYCYSKLIGSKNDNLIQVLPSEIQEFPSASWSKRTSSSSKFTSSVLHWWRNTLWQY